MKTPSEPHAATHSQLGNRNGDLLRRFQLTPARQNLVDLMRKIRYGRIEDLVIVDGDPVLGPGRVFVQEIKFGSEDGARYDADVGGYLLKRQVIDLFAYLDVLGSGSIRLLEIKAGLPFKIEAEQQI